MKSIVGLLIFALVTIFSFFLVRGFNVNEGISVIIALICGAIAEILYRRSRG